MSHGVVVRAPHLLFDGEGAHGAHAAAGRRHPAEGQAAVVVLVLLLLLLLMVLLRMVLSQPGVFYCRNIRNVCFLVRFMRLDGYDYCFDTTSRQPVNIKVNAVQPHSR